MELFRFHANRANWSISEIARSLSRNTHCFPLIDFVAEATDCKICKSKLKIQKTKIRMVYSSKTGAFEARETIKECRANKTHPVAHSEELRRLVKPRHRCTYDLIVSVGLSRYLKGKQRKEIAAELYGQFGYTISAGTITALCDTFLIYLETLHTLRAPNLRAVMQNDGYPLHLDATCENGRGGVFVCMDGLRKWVLMSGKIPSENSEYLRPLIEKTVNLFGYPISSMRDLGSGVKRSVDSLKDKGVLDLICHYHFLRAVGNKLHDEQYDKLRKLIRQRKVRSKMSAVLSDLKIHLKATQYEGKFGTGTMRENFPALLYWLLEGDGKKKPDYPFSMPHLEFYNRCSKLVDQARLWLPLPRSIPERKALKHVAGIIAIFDREKRFADTIEKLQNSKKAFCELRDILRMTDDALSNKDEPQAEPYIKRVQKLKEIEGNANNYLQKLRETVANNIESPTLKSKAIILRYLNNYWENLFGHPVLFNDDGMMVAVFERTNNSLENYFGLEKHKLRRRLGKAFLGRDLEDQPAQVFLVSNLLHQDYVRILSGTLENLPVLFEELDRKKLIDKNPTLRENFKPNLRRRVRALIGGQERLDHDRTKVKIT